MGLRDGLPICFGYFAVSFAFGIFATSSGLSILEAVFISAFNLTSAGQLAAVPIIAGGGMMGRGAVSLSGEKSSRSGWAMNSRTRSSERAQ